MQLDSVRELKQSLNLSVLASLAESITTRSAFAVPARPTVAAAGEPETLALGIARRGKREFHLAVRVQQRALEGGPLLELIRRRAHGELEVRYVGRVAKQAVPWHQRRNRPLRIGGSVGHVAITAGTLGCFVRRRDGHEPLILSNNHVLANENRGKKGDAIVQPGGFDGGTMPGDAVATLADFVKLKRMGANLVDCAVATVRDGIKINPRTLTGLGRLAALADVVVDEGVAVAKVGRTTGTTFGRVTSFELDNLVVDFDIGNLRFDNQIEIEGTNGPFSQGGDSGSLIVDGSRRAIALLFAGSDQGGSNSQGLTYANPLESVLNELEVNVLY